MMNTIKSEVADFIAERGILPPKARILAAVSGGPDSLCLLGVLQRLGYDVVVAHFDHGMREESGQDAAFVKRLAAANGLTFRMGSGHVEDYARQRKFTLEEAARILRYEFLFREAAACGAQVVATGHTMDDRAETFLMHLIRGSGPQGLRGIQPVMEISAWNGEPLLAPIRLARPLLHLARSQTEAYCRERGWQPRRDSSNDNPAIWRNRIRRELVPLLQSYNPRAVEAVCRASDLIDDQSTFVDGAVLADWQDRMEMLEPGRMYRIRRLQFQAAPKAVQQEIIRLIVSELNTDLIDFAHRHVERAVEAATGPGERTRVQLGRGIDLRLDQEFMVFQKTDLAPEPGEGEPNLLPLPGRVTLSRPEWVVETQIAEPAARAEAIANKDRWQVWLDADALRLPLFLRRRAPGDRFSPAGMPGPVNLANFLSAQHVPVYRRDRLPLLCDGNGILWIPGTPPIDAGGTGRRNQKAHPRPGAGFAGLADRHKIGAEYAVWIGAQKTEPVCDDAGGPGQIRARGDGSPGGIHEPSRP